MAARPRTAPDELRFVDPWLELPLEPTLQVYADAVRAGDWEAVKRLNADGRVAVMIHGRQALQGMRPASRDTDVGRGLNCHAAWQYGEWDRFDDPEWGPVLGLHLRELREITLAPVSCERVDHAARPGSGYFDLGLAFNAREVRRTLLQTVSGVNPWADRITTPRSAQYRRLEECVLLAWSEMLTGRLARATSFAQRAMTLGPAEDHQRTDAGDLLVFLEVARGRAAARRKLAAPGMLAGPRGPAPVNCAQLLLSVCLLSALVEPDALGGRAVNLHLIAARLGSPRMILAADAWRSAGDLIADDRNRLEVELPALLVLASIATRGLRALPLFISGVFHQRPEHLLQAARLAGVTGQVWLQVAALAWLVHIGVDAASRDLHRLLQVTGWRSLVLVPRGVSADAAVRMAARGSRSIALIEFALASREEAAIASVAEAHLRDPNGAVLIFEAAAAALGRVGREQARATLVAIASSDLPSAAVARLGLSVRSDRIGLSPREDDVLRLAAAGRTNIQIAAALSISTHTVARHLENSRTKLGAANRAEAVAGWLGVKG